MNPEPHLTHPIDPLPPPSNPTESGEWKVAETFDGFVRELGGSLRSAPIAILAAIVFLVPLLRISSLEDSFNTPKLTLLLIGGVLLSVALLRQVFVRKSEAMPGIPGGLFGYSCMAWVGLGFWHLVTVAWAGSLALAVTTLIHVLVGLSLLLLTAFVVRKPIEGASILAAGTFAAILMGGWTILEDTMAALGITTMMRRLPDWRGYLGAGLGNSGHIAGWCGLFLFPLLASHSLIRKFSPVTYAGILLIFLALVVTWSVGSTGSTLLALAVWLVVAWRSGVLSGIRLGRFMGVVAAGLAAMAFYFTPHPANPHHPSLLTEAFSSQRWKDGLPTRQVIYETTREMIRNRPLLGWGVGNFTVQYVQQKPIALMEQADLAPYAGAYTNDAHNDLLQVTAETGIVGAALAVTSVGLWFIAIFQLLRRRSIQLPERLVLLTCGCGVTVFLLDGLMSFPSRLPAHWMAFMVFQGIAAGLSVRHQPHPASARLSPAWFLPAVLLTLSLISLPYQARRVLAEWNLKSARQSAESIIVFQNGQPATVWDAIQFNIGLVTEGIAEQNAGRIKAASSSAKALVERPDLITALGYLARAERFDPRYTNATSRRSVVLMAQGRWREAGDLLDRIMLDLQSPEILDRRAICHYMLGEGAMAAALWLELAKRQPIAAKRHQFLATQALRPSLISASRDLSLPLPSQP